MKWALKSLGECPKENELLVLIKKETETFIDANSDMELLELSDATIKHIVLTAMSNKVLAQKLYNKGVEDPIFFKEMNSFLYNKSRPFLELSLFVQIEKIIQ